MVEPALRIKGLCKSFGSLIATDDLHLDIAQGPGVSGPFEIEWSFVEDLLVLVEMGYELADASVIEKFVAFLCPLIDEIDRQSLVQERQFPESLRQGVETILRGGEDGGIGPE